MSINSYDTSISKSMQLDFAIPAAKIAALSSGEFVGFVADSPEEKIKLKMFHAEIQNNHEAIAKEESEYVDIPEVLKVSDVDENYKKIKLEVTELVVKELHKISKNSENPEPEAKQSVTKKKVVKNAKLPAKSF